MTSSTIHPCPRCHGRNPDCGTCLGSGAIPGAMTTGDQGPQEPRSVGEVLREEIRRPLTPESLHGAMTASETTVRPTSFEDLGAYLIENPWLETEGRQGRETVCFNGWTKNRPGFYIVREDDRMSFYPVDEQACTPIVFDEAGFSLLRLGTVVRFDYVDGPPKGMTAKIARRITRERLDEWAASLAERCATPICLIAMGHGDNLGTSHVCKVEDVPTTALAQHLRSIADTLDSGDFIGAEDSSPIREGGQG